MNEHQKLAIRLIKHTMSELIGGLENTMTDWPEDTEEYKMASDWLSRPHDEIRNDIYNEVMSESESRNYEKHIRFAGKDFIMGQIDKLMVKWGY